MRLHWEGILARAAAIVDEHRGWFDTMMTLRQVHYRLVAEGTVPNTLSAYNTLGRRSAQARRAGWFPRLLDQGRAIVRPAAFDGPRDAVQALVEQYRRDRTEGQPYSVYVGGEKATMAPLLEAWFGPLGVPIVTARGYAGQELMTDVVNDITMTNRPAVLVYAGDLDPSGEDILRDMVARVGRFDHVERVAVTEDQLSPYGLAPAVGKAGDPRAADFLARHGRLVQVEVEAFYPPDLRDLYQSAIDRWWDGDAYAAVLAQEQRERDLLREINL